MSSENAAPKPDPRALDLARMREEYTRGEIDRDSLNPDPIAQFTLWFTQAREAGIVEPNAMSLATVASDGQPSLRTVLLKGYDQRGFCFYTNLQSRKAREMASNPRVAAMFPWVPLERQVIITGEVERVSTADALKYFLTRPRASQIAAWVSVQSAVIASRHVLQTAWDQMKQKFGDGDIPLPDFWGGYRVVPKQIEFWQGRRSRLHDRFMYTKQADGSWSIEQLSP